MEEDNYLQRLKSIRQKYGCSHQPQILTKYSTSKPSFSHNVVKNNQAAEFYQTPSRGKANQQILKFDSSRFDKLQRSYSLTDKQLATEGNAPLIHTTFKRNQNFNSFIRDLDSRIEEKERLLNVRVKQNQKLLRLNQSNLISQQSKLMRSNSFSQFRGRNQSSPYTSKPPARDIQDSNLIQKYIQLRQNEAIGKQFKQDHLQNMVEKKWLIQQNPMDTKYKVGTPIKKENNIINRYGNGNPSPLRLTLNKTENQNIYLKKQDSILIKQQIENGINKTKAQLGNYSVNKLDNIQQRIKSVLKQSNR